MYAEFLSQLTVDTDCIIPGRLRASLSAHPCFDLQALKFPEFLPTLSAHVTDLRGIMRRTHQGAEAMVCSVKRA